MADRKPRGVYRRVLCGSVAARRVVALLIVVIVVVGNLRADCAAHGARYQGRACDLSCRAKQNQEQQQIFHRPLQFLRC
jgi:hypothetical protein